MRRTIYSLAIIPYIIIGIEAQNVGSLCTLESGIHGTCALVSNCPFAADLIKNRKRPKTCEFVGLEPIVCCPLDKALIKGTGDGNIGTSSKFIRPECSILRTDVFDQLPSSQLPGAAQLKRLTVADDLVVSRIARATVQVQQMLKDEVYNIAGGIDVEGAEFPHMTRLGIGEDNRNIQWYCGGSLISDRFILTAAHCIHSLYGTINWARLGDSSSQYIQETIPVIKNVVHPDFQLGEHYNDIAVSEMRDSVTLGFNIRPACLHVERDIPTDVPITVTGWGSTEFGGDASKKLLKADLSLFTYDECAAKYPMKALRKLPRGIDDSTQFCAGGRKEVKDTCQGDSGGPIHIKITNSKFEKVYSIIGVTSFGKICGYVNQPGVYVRLHSYIPWIESIVWNTTNI